VTTGFLQEVRSLELVGKRPSGASEACQEMIELELSRGRKAMGTIRSDSELASAAESRRINLLPSAIR
jgi:hypothetical protein